MERAVVTYRQYAYDGDRGRTAAELLVDPTFFDDPDVAEHVLREYRHAHGEHRLAHIFDLGENEIAESERIANHRSYAEWVLAELDVPPAQAFSTKKVPRTINVVPPFWYAGEQRLGIGLLDHGERVTLGIRHGPSEHVLDSLAHRYRSLRSGSWNEEGGRILCLLYGSSVEAEVAISDIRAFTGMDVVLADRVADDFESLDCTIDDALARRALIAGDGSAHESLR